jgi:hypothetical protein
LLPSFSYKFLNFEPGFDNLLFGGKFTVRELLPAAALAASAAFAVFVGPRGAIATASVVLTVPLFFIMQALTEWPGHASIGFFLLLAGIALEITVIVKSVSADRSVTPPTTVAA